MDDALKRQAAELRAAIYKGDVPAVEKAVTERRDLLNLMTPFGTWVHVAATAGQLDVVKLLLAKGIAIDTPGGTYKANALNLAAANGHVDIVDWLLSHGSAMDLSAPEKNPLFAAITDGHVAVVKLLLERGIDTTVKYDRGYPTETDALAFAEERGQEAIAALLRKVKAKQP